MITNDEIPRDEWLAQCKQRALEYLSRYDVQNAVTSMMSDLGKHDDFVGIRDKMMPMAIFIMMKKDIREARRFIVGFR